MRKYYGHTVKGKGPEHWELLEDHLALVDRYITPFTQKFGAEEFGHLLAYWHDLGKYDPRFQDYIQGENGYEAHMEDSLTTGKKKVNHSNFGAQYAVEKLPAGLGELLAFIIAGHHAGLPDWMDVNPDNVKASSLEQRLKNKDTFIDTKDIPAEILNLMIKANPTFKPHPINKYRPFQLAFWSRMLFSALIDADRLATEEFCSPEKKEQRKTTTVDWSKLLEHLRAKLELKKSDSNIGRLRQQILEANLHKAESKPGLFSLTVPTGGGKTLSSMAFALKHARLNNMERIIYAIPFTSIVEQTAKVFTETFAEIDPDFVLEHHSNLDPEHEDYSTRLATENWDAPLIVTTNVQLLESLFAAKTARCRKLHRLARSVIILDEAQTLPMEFLEPCLLAINELALNYGCTIVLCTATQPAINKRENFNIGLDNVQEIIPDPQQLTSSMQRVEIHHLGQVTLDQLVEKMSAEASFLTIVNTKRDAAMLFRMLKESTYNEGLYHLSTNLCAVHRLQKLEEIRSRLTQGLPTRVISTQLIEAGVDVDFPVVFRSLAGLDSIAQAAGRCNREGKLTKGNVYVFEPTGWGKLIGYLKRAAEITKAFLINDDTSPLHTEGWLSLPAINLYFRENYWSHADQWDKHDIIKKDFKTTCLYQYREAAKKFRLIEDINVPVFVAFDKKSREAIEDLRHRLRNVEPNVIRKSLRILQRYTVGVSERDFKAMLGKEIQALKNATGEATEYYQLIYQETSPWTVNCYDQDLGLDVSQAGILSVDQSVF